ncbi:restriction endonuclease subunit S [Bacillus methanolicus]|uniref:restriction endonuclease subunit S n=1 Tax=Bacillus methanolicus TaxID=1471 RepID=UPI00200E3ED4|nr:restriction endonuclease subunit S [Bacillus methanolicus]
MEKIKLKDLFVIRKGKKVDPVEAPTEDTVRYIQIEDLRDDNHPKYCLANENYVFANKNNIIIAWDGANAGTVSYGLEGVIGSTLAILETEEKNIYIPYVGKFLQSIFNYLRDTCTGATIPHISRNALENLIIPIPSLEKQKFISDTLDKVKEIIYKRKAQIEALDQLMQSVFLEMFGDPINNTKDWRKIIFNDVINSIRYGTSTPPEFSNDGYKFIRATNIKKGKIINDDMLFINEKEAEKLDKCKLKLHELIFVRSGVNSGDNAIVTEEYAGHYGGYDIIVNINNEIVNPYYLNALFNSVYLDLIIKPLTRRAGQPHLNADQIKNLNIQLPPKNLQNKFANIYKKIDKEKLNMIENLRALEQNFNSLMQRAFKGELFTEEKVSYL